MIASAAARRCGLVAIGPPSWKISSTMTTRLRSWTSGMLQAPLHEMQRDLKFRRSDHADVTLEAERCGVDQSLCTKFFGYILTCIQGLFDFLRQKAADIAGNREIKEVGIRGNFTGGNTLDCDVSRQIDGIGDDGGGSIGVGGAFSENCDRVGYAERKTAAAPAAGGDAAYGHGRGNFHGTK